MINLGFVRPGATLRIPFSSFDKDDGSSITMTNYAAADILVYKDGSTTERASTAGFTATTDFDTKTGKHLAIIDLSDNTTAGFFSAGSEYLVAIDAVTVDTVTVGGWIARFIIGFDSAILNTTIATLSTQTSFTLSTGPAEDDALNGSVVYIHDVASAVQGGYAIISDYTGASKTVTLAAGTTYTAAATDNISVFPPVNLSYILGAAVSTSTAQLGVNVVNYAGSAVGTPDTAGYPKVTIKSGTGTGEVSLSSGTVTAGTVSDKTGYAITSSEHTNIADALLKRDMSAVSGESARSPLNAFRFLRNKWTASGGTLTVYKEDDTTSAWTSALTDTAGANPITASDPA